MFTKELAALIVAESKFHYEQDQLSKNNKKYNTTKTQRVQVEDEGHRYDITLCVNRWEKTVKVDKSDKILTQAIDKIAKTNPEKADRVRELMGLLNS